jgi:hypothetical protein
MIFDDRIGDMMQQGGFAGAWRRNDQAALSHAQRRHQIHDSRRIAIRDSLELDPSIWIDRRQLFKWSQPWYFVGSSPLIGSAE